MLNNPFLYHTIRYRNFGILIQIKILSSLVRKKIQRFCNWRFKWPS